MRLSLLILTIMYTTLEAQSEAWVDTSLYPFENRHLELEAGTMHYIDEGQGDIILFIHGTPTWSFLYRDFIKDLSTDHRCIAIDHLGFGLSEKPADLDGSPSSHSQNLDEFISKMDLDNITLVVHDFGGPIGLGWTNQNPDKVNRIVMFNTWLWETASNPEVVKIDKTINSGMGRFLYFNMNFSPRVLLKQGFANKKNLSKEVHRQYIKAFPDKKSRTGPYQLAQALKASSDWYEDQWKKLDVLDDKPWLILWGEKDKFLKPDYLQKWSERLPNARVETLDCGHFVQEEETESSVDHIRRFLLSM